MILVDYMHMHVFSINFPWISLILGGFRWISWISGVQGLAWVQPVAACGGLVLLPLTRNPLMEGWILESWRLGGLETWRLGLEAWLACELGMEVEG